MSNYNDAVSHYDRYKLDPPEAVDPEAGDPDELEIDDYDRYCEQLEREWYDYD